MINKYQLYHLYKELAKLGTAKKLTNKIFSDLQKKSLFSIANENFYMTPNIDKSANYFIEIANDINSGIFSLNDFAISLINEYITLEKFPTLSSRNSENIRKFTIFKNKKEIIDQSNFLKNLVEEKNKGMFEFSDRFTLFKVDLEQKNEIYRLIKNKKVSIEFYARALETGKFTIDENKIQDKEYLKFVKLITIINKIKNEVK